MVELRTAIEVLESGARYLKFQQDDGTNRYVRENEDGTTEQINRFAFSGGNRGRSRRLVDSGEFVEQQFEQPDGDIYSRIPDGDGGYNYFRNGSKIKGQAYAGASSSIKRYRIQDSDSNVRLDESTGATFKRKDKYSFDLPPIDVCQNPAGVFSNVIEDRYKQHIENYIAPNDDYDKFQAFIVFKVNDRGNMVTRSIKTQFISTDNAGYVFSLDILENQMVNKVPDFCRNYNEVVLDKITLIGRVKG